MTKSIFTKDIYIGVDGGGSKSKAYIEDADGNVIGTAIDGPSNIRLSVDTAWNSIYSSINQVLSKKNISLESKDYHFHIGLGLAGTEVPDACERFLARPHPFASLRLESDGYAACLGAHNNKDGAIIIIGTGINGFQIQHGKTVQVSGWGFPHDDIGGGSWLGLRVTQMTLQWLDGRIEQSTPLLETIYKHFHNDMSELVTWANAANATQFATLAPFVIEYVNKEDPSALMLIKDAAAAIDQVALAMEKRAIDKNDILPVCLFGGIAPFMRPWLSQKLQNRLIERAHDASVGAVFMIRNPH